MELNLNNSYSIVQNDTLLDEYRLLTLLKLLAQTFNTTGVVVEFGVFKGGTTQAIAKTCKDYNVEKDIYLFDTFSGPTASSRNKASANINEVQSFELIKTYNHVKTLLSDYSNVQIINGDIMDTTKQLEKNMINQKNLLMTQVKYNEQ